MISIFLYGRTRVHAAGRVLLADAFPGIKPRNILELLTLARGASISKPALAEQLWDGRPPTSWPATLESYVALLRRTLEPGVPGRRTVVATASRGYRLDMDRVTVDLDTFDQLTERAARLPVAESLPAWERALLLAHREPLEDEPYAKWAADAREAHREAVLGATQRAAEAALALRRPERAAVHAEHATRIDPLAEHSWQLLLRALAQAGHRAEAVNAFHACQAALRRELGIDPGPATRQLFERIVGDGMRPRRAASGD
jgi:DNA-binding SARP family transcriptional activator